MVRIRPGEPISGGGRLGWLPPPSSPLRRSEGCDRPSLATRLTETVILTWVYEPADYLEIGTGFLALEHQIIVSPGTLEARIDGAKFDRDMSLRSSLDEHIRFRFRAIAAETHRPYKLQRSTMVREVDGRRQYFLKPEPLRIEVRTSAVDLVVKDATGKVIRDTKQERVERNSELSEIAARASSAVPLAAHLYEIYEKAINDPADEFVHLYEIRDALAKEFGGEAAAVTKLNVTRKEWSRLGQLANGEPLSQGRHRGGNIGSQRPATKDELNEARQIARKLVSGYVGYLVRVGRVR